MALVGLSFLAACEDPEVILAGKREDVSDAYPPSEIVNVSRAVRLPAQTANANWTHRIGTQSYRVNHAALSAAPQLAWSAGIGAGEDRRHRITADPVVADGRVFAMDALASVAAVSTAGEPLWRREMVPARDQSGDGAGGGLAYANGKLYVTTGFGRLLALNPASGETIWEQKLEATGNGSPTVFDGRVYVVAGDDVAWALNAETGRIEWRLGSLPDVKNVQTAAAPALTPKMAIFGFGSGDVQAAFRKGGLRLWDSAIVGERPGRSVNTVGDISSDPVVVGNVVYAANHSGRVVALNIDNGKRLWTTQEGALSPVWPLGDSIYLVSERNQLVRIDARDGSRVWAVNLSLFVKDRPRRQARMHAHYGPVLAGGRLVVASSDGHVRFFDPASGELTGTVSVPGGATSNPVVAGRTLYLVSTDGKLHAFR